MILPVALTIAGSDSGGGAGIAADLKTFAALGCHGTCAVTAVTAQDTRGVSAIEEMPLQLIEAQITAVMRDLKPRAVKTGMLSSSAIIESVVQALSQHPPRPLVVDPVMVAKGGAKLLRDDAVGALRSRLLPLAHVLTPNLPEAEILLGRSLESPKERERGAQDLVRMGCRAALIKGGHAEGEAGADDVLFDGERVSWFSAERIKTSNTHGSGCTYSAAITAELARGQDLISAVEAAKAFITEAIRWSLELGSGHGPVNPMHRLRPS